MVWDMGALPKQSFSSRHKNPDLNVKLPFVTTTDKLLLYQSPCSLTLCLHYDIYRLVSHDVFINHSVKDQELSNCIYIYLGLKALNAS